MAVDVRCPNCGNNMGKDKENPKVVICDECDQEINNPKGN